MLEDIFCFDLNILERKTSSIMVDTFKRLSQRPVCDMRKRNLEVPLFLNCICRAGLWQTGEGKKRILKCLRWQTTLM